jgi:hypothetical protein
MKLILSFFIVCFISTASIYAQQSCVGNDCLPAKVKSDCTVMESNGCIDWDNGIIYATGMGVPNPKFETQAQKTYSAYQAAKTVAMRNLLQMVQGINITSTRTVKAGMLEDDTINTQISGKIRQVQEAGKPQTMNDGSVWVTMKMYMRDIISILVNNQQFTFKSGEMFQKPEKKAPIEEVEKEEGPKYGGDANTVYTGVIIDARGTGVVPAMSPKIYGPDGKEIYGSIAVERDFALQHGIVGYVKDLDGAKSNERVKGNPLLIKAGLSGDKTSDLVISEEDAELLTNLDATQSFLREARVIVIIG